VQPAPGNYDDYTQWVYQNNDTLTLVRDRGPVVPGIASYALSPDGHELEMRFPFKGFLKNAANDANIALGKTIDVSFSLEASGELFAPPGNNGIWGSDTATPITSYLLEPAGVPGDYNNNGVVDAADYVLWRNHNNTAVTLPNDLTPGTNPSDYTTWHTHFGQTTASASAVDGPSAIPEPATALIVLIAVLLARMTHQRGADSTYHRRRPHNA